MIPIAGQATHTESDWVAGITAIHNMYGQTWGAGILLSEFVRMAFEEAVAQNLNADALMGLMIEEKGWTMDKGYVPVSSHNPGNLGATDGTGLYASFPDWRTGIKATAQHLAVYAGIQFTEPVVSQRTADIKKWGYFGLVTYVEDLGGTEGTKTLWSTMENYGTEIASIINGIPRISATPLPYIVPAPTKEPVGEPVVEEVPKQINKPNKKKKPWWRWFV